MLLYKRVMEKIRIKDNNKDMKSKQNHQNNKLYEVHWWEMNMIKQTEKCINKIINKLTKILVGKVWILIITITI